MIRSFQSKALKRFYERGDARGLPPQFAGKVKQVLFALDSASSVTELDIPGFSLHALKGNRLGYWAIVVTRNWRITFRFRDAGKSANGVVTGVEFEVEPGQEPLDDEAGAHEVDYEDYH